MHLGFFTMPIHPLDKDWRQSLREDRDAFILADELGFSEAYVGEHTTDKAENITSCTLFLASLVGHTRQIRLGTGTVNLPNTHPARVAGEIAMLDHMLDGRLNFGISPGGLPSDAEAFGTLGMDRNAMFVEAIDQVLKIWASDPPYDIVGKHWSVTTRKTLIADIGQGLIPKPLQLPHPPDRGNGGGAVLQGHHRGAARGWEPISANFLMPAMGAEPLAEIRRWLRARGPPRRSRQLARRQEHLRRRRQRHRPPLCHRPGQPIPLLLQPVADQDARRRPHRVVQGGSRQSDDSVTLDAICDRLIIHGTPDEVADKLLAFREEVGDFGTLLYAGHDWATRFWRVGARC